MELSAANLFLIERDKAFLPKNVFDAHTHMTYMPGLLSNSAASKPGYDPGGGFFL